MTRAPEPEREPVPPTVALVFTLVGFIALVIGGLGVVSLITDQDVIATPGLGPLPGVLGILLAAAAFTLSLWLGLRRPQPSFWNALWAGLASFLGYLLGIVIGILVGGADPAIAAGVAGRLATGLFGVVVAVAGLIAAWSAIALVRTRAQQPRWPWERDDDH